MYQKVRILVLGATGYIGGSTLSKLLEANNDSYILSALVRKPEQAAKLEEAGVTGILFKDLDDSEAITNAAKEHDIIIGAASARHQGSVKAILEGLGQRKGSPLGDVHYIHTSGASMLGDWPESGRRADTSIHSDVDEDIYLVERQFPKDEPCSPVRDLNQLVVEIGEQKGVRTYIVPPPLIFGRGTGLFTEGVGQVHMLTELALKAKQAVMVGSGSGIWNRVHIKDLSNLYLLLTQRILSQKATPHGKTGYYFAENGYQSWKSIATGIGKVGKEFGIFATDAVGNVELQEVADRWYGGNVNSAEGVLASNARIKADRARYVLGWSPNYGDDVFENDIREVVTTMSKKGSSS
ncbi:NAD dependent epimerase/dehydratase family protein [Bisporella sp. PMI_857]|nr:NAD dependent epimerase/dehydratase family protein [Bisporella sp. PMI_857]